MEVQIVKHRRLADGSYLLVVDPGDGSEREFRWGPLTPDMAKYEGGKPYSEDEYLQMQVREATALVRAELDAAATTNELGGVTLPTEGIKL